MLREYLSIRSIYLRLGAGLPNLAALPYPDTVQGTATQGRVRMRSDRGTIIRLESRDACLVPSPRASAARASGFLCLCRPSVTYGYGSARHSGKDPELFKKILM
jgi:hypothetical protein